MLSGVQVVCNSMDYSLPGSSVHGISQARILEWAAILQGIFLTQGSNLSLLHWQASSLLLSHNKVESLSLLSFSHSVVSDSLWLHELQHARLPCPSPSPGVFSNSCPSSRWFHLTILSPIIPFFSCFQSFPASGSFPMSRLFASDGQVLELQFQHQSFQWIFRTDLL